MSQPAYGPTRLLPRESGARLQSIMEATAHQRVVEDVSLLDGEAVDLSRVRGGGTVTDTYLLALAVTHRITLATLDGRIDAGVVRGGEASLFVVR